MAKTIKEMKKNRTEAKTMKQGRSFLPIKMEQLGRRVVQENRRRSPSHFHQIKEVIMGDVLLTPSRLQQATFELHSQCK
jgi:hypothetical protein